MTIEQEVMKAKIALLLKERLFGGLVTFLDIYSTKDSEVITACTDGEVIEYSPKFFKQCTRSQIVAVLAHEVLHCVFGHHIYRDNRDLKLWNQAGDYVINPILVDSYFELPGEPLLDNRFRGMNTVQVYNILAKEQGLPKDGGTGGSPSPGEVTDSPSKSNHEKLNQEEQVWKQRVAQALTNAKLAGAIPSGLERALSTLLIPKVSWREALWEVVQEKAQDDYSFLKPNRKYTAGSIILPSLFSERIKAIVVAVDTSGSVSTEELTQFASEIEEIQAVMGTDIAVVYCDTKVQNFQKFEPGDPIKLEPKGGGGTRYSPVFSWVEKEEINPSCLIYLTDGQCSDFPKEAPYDFPTLWVTNRSGWKPPFGTVVEF
ncbi:MAG: hypothetical protein EHM49_00340 [Deltaproteobacteria bacterium]|nr:MAG: hypothetical protein EHM49_00340 [Deltaproteobacteria bacterium]